MTYMVYRLYIICVVEYMYDYFIHMSVKDSEHLRQFVFNAITSREAVTTVETSLIFEHSRSGVVPNFDE